MLLENPSFELKTDEGEYLLFLPAPSVGVAVVRGIGTEELARAMMDQTRILFRTQKSLAIFVDVSEMKSYQTAARTTLTAFMKESLSRFHTIQIYVRSKIVSMGVAVANVALDSRIEAHASRARFDAAMQLEVDRVLGLKRPSLKP